MTSIVKLLAQPGVSPWGFSAESYGGEDGRALQPPIAGAAFLS
jgi:hypothetical protein